MARLPERSRAPVPGDSTGVTTGEKTAAPDNAKAAGDESGQGSKMKPEKTP